MEYSVGFSRNALADLAKIEAYLAKRFSSRNARTYILRLTQACIGLGQAPFRGASREDLAPGMRVIGFERRVSIYFQVGPNRVSIKGLFYGGKAPRTKI